MKKLIVLYISILLLFLSGCANYFDDSSENYADGGNAGGQTSQEVFYELKGRVNPSSSRAATAQVNLSSLYFKISGENLTTGKTYTGTVDSAEKTYSILLTNGSIKLTIDGFTDAACSASKKVLSGSTTFVLTDGEITSGSSSISLSAAATSSGKGTVSLPVTISAGSGVTAAKAVWLSGAVEKSQTLNLDSSDTLKLSDTFVLLSDAEITAGTTTVKSGSYDVTFLFSKTDPVTGLSSVVYSFTEIINVFDNLTTDCWINNVSAPYMVSDGDGGIKIQISNSIISTASSNRTEFFVKDTGDDTDGEGSFFKPLASVQRAVDLINLINDETTEYTITLCSDITASDYSNFQVLGNVKNMIVLAPAKNLKVKIQSNASANNRYKIDAAASSSQECRVFYVKALVELTLENIQISGGYAVFNYSTGGGIYNLGKLHMNNCEVSGNTGYYSGGLTLYTGSYNEITNCIFTNNSCTITGGAIWNRGDSIITDCQFIQNTARFGGAIYNRGTLTINGGLFKKNKAEIDDVANGLGGAICINESYNNLSDSEDGSVVIKGDVKFEENYAKYYGGAICINSENGKSKTFIEGGTFTGNTAGIYGDGIYIRDKYANDTGDIISNLTISGSTLIADEDIFLNYCGESSDQDQKYITVENLTGESSTQTFKISLASYIPGPVIVRGITAENNYKSRFTIYDDDGITSLNDTLYLDDDGKLCTTSTVHVYDSDWNELCTAVNAVASGLTDETVFYIKGTFDVTKDLFIMNQSPVRIIPIGQVIIEPGEADIDNFFLPDASLTLDGVNDSYIQLDGTAYAVKSSPISFATAGLLTLNYVQFTNFNISSGGGALKLSTNTTNAVINHCTFSGNTMNDYDGAALNIDVTTTSAIKVIRCTFNGNTAKNGGAVALTGDVDYVNFEECIFTGNHSTQKGGAVYHNVSVYHPGSIYIKYCSFKNNYSADSDVYNGGAVYSTKGYIVFDEVTASGNYCGSTDKLSDFYVRRVEKFTGRAGHTYFRFRGKCTVPAFYYDFGTGVAPEQPLMVDGIAGSKITMHLSDYEKACGANILRGPTNYTEDLTQWTKLITIADSHYQISDDIQHLTSGSNSWYITKFQQILKSVDGTWQVNDLQDLQYVRDCVNNGKTINKSRKSTGTDPVFEAAQASYILTNDINCGTSDWIPIGDTETTAFTGTFDGNEKTVSYTNDSSTSDDYKAGVFGYLASGGVLKNLDVYAIVAVDDSPYAGGILGSNEGTVFNCNLTGTSIVGGKIGVGGIVAYNKASGLIEECTVSGDSAISTLATYSNYYCGGIAGLNEGIISGCSNGGKVATSSSTSQYVGGIAGINEGGIIYECENTGLVKAGSVFGGIVGYNLGKADKGSVVDKCINTGTVTSLNTATELTYIDCGGIVGKNTTQYSVPCIIRNCKNSGTVEDTSANHQDIGGIAGYNTKSKILNCFNTGTIKGGNYVAGICGYSVVGSNIQNVYSTATVEKSGTNGAVITYLDNSSGGSLTLSNFYYPENAGMSAVLKKSSEAYSDYSAYNADTLLASVTINGSSVSSFLEALNAWVTANDSENIYLKWKANTPGAPQFIYE